MREVTTEPVEVPPQPAQTLYSNVEHRYCDYPGCKTEIVEDPSIGRNGNELLLALDPDECVSYLHRRDYCTRHISSIWSAMCRVIGANPDAERSGMEGGLND